MRTEVTMIKNTFASKRKFSTRQTVVIGLLFAITIILGGTGLGFLPIPPFKTTIMHIPVIIGAILEGPVVGAIIGLLFGLFSIFQAINTPTPVSFIFLNPIVAVLPRMLIGITSYYGYKLIKTKSKTFNIAVAAAIGSFTNTLGVVALIFALYLDAYANAFHVSRTFATNTLLGLILQGFLTATITIIITVPVVMSVSRSKLK